MGCRRIALLLFLCGFATNEIARADSGLISTIAGNGVPGNGGVGGPATQANLNSPSSLCVDAAGNLFIADSYNQRVVRVDAVTGLLTVAAASITTYGLALDATGGLLIADVANRNVRRLDLQAGTFTTVAGNGSSTSSGDGGLATNAGIAGPMGLALDASGNLYIAEMQGNRIRRVDAQTGIITTVAGNGYPGFSNDGGLATNAALSAPIGVSVDSSGNLFISDFSNRRIRRVDASTGIISTTAGTGSTGFTGDGVPAASAPISGAGPIAIDAAGNLYFADHANDRVRRIDAATGLISTVAGNGMGSWGSAAFGDGGPATSAMLNTPSGVALTANGNLLVSEQDGARVRRVFLPAPYAYTTTSVSSNPNPSGEGQQVTFSATVAPISASGVPTGSVSFINLSAATWPPTVLGTAPLSGGTATFVTSLGLFGPYRSIVASYSGDSSFSGSTSPVLAHYVKPGTTTTLTANPSVTNPNTPVNFSVTVAAIGTFSYYPTGTVQLFDGDTLLTAGGLSGGTVQFNVSFSSSGAHSITAVYAGDFNFWKSTSAAVSETVNPATATTTTVAAQPNPATANQTITFTASVTPAAATGLVQFLDGSTLLGGNSVTNGVASFSVTLAAGSHTIKATYGGDGNYYTSSSSPLIEVVKAVSSVTVVSSANPSTTGQAVTFTATVTPSTATGSVQFLDNGTAIGTGTLASGVATFSTSTLTAGTHSITAAYGGDSNFAAATSAAITQTVKTASSATVASSANPATAGQAITFTATVSPSTATGSVQFSDGSTVIGTGTIASGVATFSTSTLTAGTHSITAAYGGDSNFAAATSAAITQTVRTASSVALTSSANPSNPSQVVTFTATVTPSTATGSVQFSDGSTVIGTGTIASGVAAFSTSTLTAGTHSITAAYGGDSNFAAATSAAITQTVKTASSATVASSANPATAGQAITFTATVSPSTATGSVQFSDGSTVIGTGTIASGVATFSTSTLTAGTHSISAAYGGDSNFAAATSAAITQTVQAASSVSLGVNAPNPVPGQTVTFTANITPSSATGSVQFLDGTTVMGTAAVASGVATFSTSTLALGAHSITAVYSGDAIDTGATSAAMSISVKASVSLSLAQSVNPSTVGQTVTFTATITPSAATGTVQFLDNGTVIGTATLASGVATFATSALTQGTHPISLLYSGDANYMGASTSTWAQVVKAVSSVTVVSSANPATAGQTVTFTATATPSTATGSVQFLDGAAVIGTGTIASGVATFSTSTLTAGTHSITAAYGGDSNFAAATSTAITQTVQAASSVSLGVNAPNPVPGQAVTFTANITPSVATGSVQFLDGATLMGTATVASGVATFSTSTLAQGPHSITAVYSGDAMDTGATSAPLSLSVKASVSLGLSSSANPSTVGQAVTFTVTITPAAATGTVQFLDNGTVIGAATLASGVATFATSTMTQGTHPISLLYSGDANYMSASTSSWPQTVKASSSVTITSGTNPSNPGQAVTFTATVTPSTATGSVQFLDGGAVIATATLASGVATFSTSTLTSGTHSVTAAYGGDSNSAAATSTAITQTVKATGSVALVSSVNPSVAGQAVTFTATIAPSTATGSVQFLDGGAVIGTTTVASGVATFSTSTLTSGTHSITAVYGGNLSVTGATSAAVAQTVKSTAAVGIATNAPNPVPGQNITFTASITPSTATDSVQFLDNGSVIGASALASGAATFSTSTLALGSHSVTAVYGGDSNVTGGTSAALVFSIKATPGLTLTSNLNPSTLGQTVTFTARVSPTTATGSIQFLDGAAVIGTAAVASGVAAFSSSSLAQGMHSISLVYSGDAYYMSASSSAMVQTVKANSAAALASSVNPSTTGQAVTFTVSVIPSSATGTAQFLDGATSLGTVTLSNGSGSITTSALTAGVHSIQAIYGGDAVTNPSSSSVLSETMKTATTVTLTSNRNPAYHTTTVTFTAKVAPSAAMGSVQFFDGSTLLGTSGLSSGSASLSLKLSAGTHPIQAVYGGDSSDAGSASATLTETIH